MKKSRVSLTGASYDSLFLISVRVVTLCLGLLITRVLSGFFSLQEYGTYSQILLLVTTISNVTTLGMMDGINYFFCKEPDDKKRDAYVSTIFFLHFSISTFVSLIVLLCTTPISKYFGNADIKSLIIFAAILPVSQNTISLLQVMFIAIGKAKQIAIRNLAVSVMKLIAVVLSCYMFDSIWVLFVCQVITDSIQIIYFMKTLKKNNCKIFFFHYDMSLVKEILIYCIPMAMFSVMKSLNRDSDKYVISFFTDTETLAVYTNASKILPFDIIMTSFVTVLMPYITRFVTAKKYKQCQTLYKSFLELAYIVITVLAVGAIYFAHELFTFLYTEKYASEKFAIPVFIIYILVDIISVLNITLILTAAGKTKSIMFASLFTFVGNITLNIGMFLLIGEIGPAIATVIVTLVQGIVILFLSAKEIEIGIHKMFNTSFLFVFLLEVVSWAAIIIGIRHVLVLWKLPDIIIMGICYILYVIPLIVLNRKKIKNCLKIINGCKYNQG